MMISTMRSTSTIYVAVVALALAAAPVAAPAQARPWSAVPALTVAGPVGTMGDYLGRGLGIGLGLRRGNDGLAFRADVSWTHFAARTVSRPLGGKGSPIAITSSANTMLLLGGPELSIRPGRFRFAVGAGAGAAHFLSTG